MGLLHRQHNGRAVARIEATPVTYPFSFCIAGDTGFQPNATGDVYVVQALKHMGQLTPTPLFFANLGDFSGPGTVERHRHYRALLRDLASPGICVMGNHELDDAAGESNFRAIAGAPNFSFAYGNTLFVAIRSLERRDRPHGPEPEDLAFLDAQLTQKAGGHPVRVVFMHMPPNLDGHYAPRGSSAWAFTHLESEFLRITRYHRVTIVCCAHITGYDRHAVEGMTVLVSGAGGGAVDTAYSGLFPDHPPVRAGFEHFVQLTVEASGAISGRVHRIAVDGVKEDRRYAFRCSGAPQMARAEEL